MTPNTHRSGLNLRQLEAQNDQSSEESGVVPRSAVFRAGDGGVALRGNTDTVNPFGVVLVDQHGLAGADIPHPEW